ncbi:MAG: SDR family oxidoreductase [Deltaproteobacteria bacterium]|nr:SDR family oxidoreductase [Deltaproteobacteria bacterium]
MTAPVLQDKVVVVTGASRGIGRATAALLATHGARVVGCGLQASTHTFLDDLPEALRVRCRFVRCDVADSEDVERFARQLVTSFGVPDVLVNNAGIVVRGALEDLDDATWQRMLDVNVSGVFYMTRAFLRAMKMRGTGRIINLSSIAGRQGTAQLVSYCTAKHAVVGFTRALAEELRGTDIKVNAVCPGSVDTEMLQIGMPGGTPNMSPADIANVVLYLASSAPAALSGSCVDVFG